MADLQARARAALEGRRGASHAATLREALVPSLSEEDVAWVDAQLAARAKGELRPTKDGAVPVHRAWSSTQLVASAFAFWRTRPQDLVVPGVDGPFTDVRLEERLAIPHGGGNPNLDVALDGPDGLVGIEAKLTEHLRPSTPRPWKPAYHRPAMRAALDGAWRVIFDDLRDGRWAPRRLDAGQLVRHALSLRGAGTLVYLRWAPEPLPDHDAELAELQDRLGADAAPAFRALTYGELFAAWEGVAPEHVRGLRSRYGPLTP